VRGNRGWEGEAPCGTIDRRDVAVRSERRDAGHAEIWRTGRQGAEGRCQARWSRRLPSPIFRYVRFRTVSSSLRSRRPRRLGVQRLRLGRSLAFPSRALACGANVPACSRAARTGAPQRVHACHRPPTHAGLDQSPHESATARPDPRFQPENPPPARLPVRAAHGKSDFPRGAAHSPGGERDPPGGEIDSPSGAGDSPGGGCKSHGGGDGSPRGGRDRQGGGPDPHGSAADSR